MREMKDRAGHGEQGEHDHQQSKGVIDPGELLRGAADGSGRSAAARCGRSAMDASGRCGSFGAAGVSSLVATGTVSSALAVCGTAWACGRTGNGWRSPAKASKAPLRQELAGGGRRSYRRPLAPVPRSPLAAREVVAARPARTLSRHQTAVPFSGREVLPARAASTDDYCWRDRSGSTSADQVVSRAFGLARQSSAACVVRIACADSAAIKTRANIADGRIVLRPGMRPPPTLYKEMQPGFETKVSDADWKWRMGLQYVAISASAAR